MPLDSEARLVNELATQGYNAEREAITLLANAPDPDAALESTVETAPADALVLSADHVRVALADPPPPAPGRTDTPAPGDGTRSDHPDAPPASNNPSVSGGAAPAHSSSGGGAAPGETEGSHSSGGRVDVAGDVTGRSTGTGTYEDFAAVFRDRYERLSTQLRGRVTHRPATAIEAMSGGSDTAMVGMIADIRSTSGGHRLLELEDTTGTVTCLVLSDRDVSVAVDELLMDEVVAVEGTLADDAGVLFVDELHFPDVPRTHTPSTADRHVKAALVSDIHVGSREFTAGAWSAFADWLHGEAAEAVEYLLIAGDMVEGVGVYPGQDEELAVVDIYDQYRRFSEHLKEVPGDLEIVMIPGNHDAVRLAEPQPAFDEDLRTIMSAHDARIVGNPSTVTIEDVSVLMYHGVSLDEVIAELPDEKASYDDPHRAMTYLLKKRHLAPQFGGHIRLAPEDRDYLVVEDVPDVFHAGHVHKLGVGQYHNVLVVNSGCWQTQTTFQRSVNLDPDAGYAPVVSLDTLDVEVMSF